MSSVNGFFVEPMCAGYCATKGAIIALTKAMAIDHGREGVRVNCICPGYIDAGLAEAYFQAQPDPAAARAAAGQPARARAHRQTRGSRPRGRISGKFGRVVRDGLGNGGGRRLRLRAPTSQLTL